jgi:PKD repeat protein
MGTPKRVATLAGALLLLLASPAAGQVVADFSADVVSGTSPLTVSFTDLSTGGPSAWIWDFGDGNGSNEQHPSHTYGAGGPYTVELIAIQGLFDSDTLAKPDLITVDPAVIVVDFAPSLRHGVDSLETTFTDSTTPTPSGWLWDFGDGTTSTEQHPSHTYQAWQASYDVTLTVDLLGQPAAATQPDLILMAPEPITGPIPVDVGLLDVFAAGDVDGDGDQDAFFKQGSGNGDMVWYRFDSTAGAYEFAASFDSFGFGTPFDLCDLDGDGDLDIVQIAAEADWYENTDGQGAFVLAGSFDVASNGHIDTGDLDGDGDLDVVTGSSTLNASWHANAGGAAAFGPAQSLDIVLVSNSQLRDLLTHDVDGDGDLDVAWAGWLNGSTGWSENDSGDGSTWATQVIVADEALDVDFADLDGDGDDDLLLAHSEWPLAWYENTDGAGTFGAANVLPGGLGNEDELEAVDMDRDGDLDVVSSAPFGPFTWRSNLDGAGTFGPPSELSPNGNDGLLAVDVDGDGDGDLLTSELHAGLRWYRNDVSVAWADAGPGLAGPTGLPELSAAGGLAPGDLVNLALENGLPFGGVAFLVLGASALNAPFKGGTLVPFPDVAVGLPVGSNGVLVVQSTWPGGIPGGLPIYAQYWIADPGGPHGFAASNALVGTTEP